MEKVVDMISENVPRSDDEYLGQDGLLHCRVCGKAVQYRFQLESLNIDKLVRCICDCKKAELEEKERASKQEEYDRMRRQCFAESNMAKWTFAKDDRRDEKISDAMRRYADNFADFKKDSKGLLLYGTVGTGKTYFAACIANNLIDKGYRVLMTNFARLINQIQGMYDGKQNFIDSLNRYDLLIIDDLGAERQSEFMQEQVFNIIDARYRSGLPLIVTTNLTSNQLKNPDNISYTRIYDRILERCFPVEVTGASRRRAELKNSHADIKAKLGL